MGSYSSKFTGKGETQDSALENLVTNMNNNHCEHIKFNRDNNSITFTHYDVNYSSRILFEEHSEENSWNAMIH